MFLLGFFKLKLYVYNIKLNHFMSKLRFLCFFAALLMQNVYLFAQSVWTDGFIVKSDGTLVTGLVQLPKQNAIPEICVFKRFDIAESFEYAPDRIKAFGLFNGAYFESKTYDNQTKFYQVLIKGRVTLLADKKSLYVSTDSNDLIRLASKSTEPLIHGEKRSYDNHVALLKDLLKDDPQTTVRENLKLNETEIVSIINQYNLNMDATSLNYAYAPDKNIYADIENSGGFRFRWGVMTGSTFSLYTIDNEDFKFNMTGFHPDLTAGMFFNYRLSRKPGKPEIRVEALLRRSALSMFDEEPGRLSVVTVRRYTSFSYSGIKVPVMINFNFPGKKINGFARSGLAYTLLTEGSYLRKNETEYTDDVVRVEFDRSLSLLSSETSILLGGGIQYSITPTRVFSLELRSEFGQGIFKSEVFDKFNQNSQVFSLLIGYSF
jgi:hypothetical protein